MHKMQHLIECSINALNISKWVTAKNITNYPCPKKYISNYTVV